MASCTLYDVAGYMSYVGNRNQVMNIDEARPTMMFTFELNEILGQNSQYIYLPAELMLKSSHSVWLPFRRMPNRTAGRRSCHSSLNCTMV